MEIIRKLLGLTKEEKLVECKWCGQETLLAFKYEIDYFGYSGTHCQHCKRSVDEGYRDWILRKEWPGGVYSIEYASGTGCRIGLIPKSIPPTKVFSRSATDALKNYPHVIMYPDSGGYTGIWISPNEARFFVYGRLFKHISSVKNVAEVFLAWRPVMDEILRREAVLRQDVHRHGIHIDEIVDMELKERISQLVGNNT